LLGPLCGREYTREFNGRDVQETSHLTEELANRSQNDQRPGHELHQSTSWRWSRMTDDCVPRIIFSVIWAATCYSHSILRWTESSGAGGVAWPLQKFGLTLDCCLGENQPYQREVGAWNPFKRRRR
jgi:hypothetical protein